MYCDECGFKNKKEAKFCKQCGARLIDEESLKIEESSSKVLEREFDITSDTLKISQKELLEYLNLGKEIEINKLGLENSIKDLQLLDHQKKQEIVHPLNKGEEPKFKFFDKDQCFVILGLIMYLALPLYIFSVYIYDKFYRSFFHKFFASDFPDIFAAVPVAIILALIIFIIGTIIYLLFHNIFTRQTYLSKLKKYQKECTKIDEENNAQLITYNGKKDIIAGRINNINHDLADVEKTLATYYNLDIIYPKYRNLVALTTFIEYLESGRCKSLYGYDGCYNVYEQELRQDTIIGKLDQVLLQLDQIKKMQYATYLAVQQSNLIGQAFLDTCNEMLSETRKENAYLEAQAQDAKIIKRNSEIMTTISELNYIKK